MSQYIQSPFKPSPQLAVAGTPSYLLGSYNDRTGPTYGTVLSDSAVTTTATLTFQIVSGNIPVVGALVTVVGAANSANFNVTNVAIASVSTTAAGVCTITYTITSTSQGTLSDGGQVIIPQPEVGETVSGSNYASVPVARPYNNPDVQEGQALSATINLLSGGTLSANTVVLQAADIDIESEYQTVYTFTSTGSSGNIYTFQSGQGTAATVAAVNLLNYRFYRFKFTGTITGTGAVVGKIEF
jgi:hypothetical protein